MSNPCARCEKTVYPMEELRAMDKVYHKTCFRCSECGCLLNIKNAKGYNKMPYCPTHYPKDKASSVIDTPTNLQALNNSKMQSERNYHREFEKQKGTGIGGVPAHRIEGDEKVMANEAVAEES